MTLRLSFISLLIGGACFAAPFLASADVPGSANGSSCNLNGQGPGTGLLFNGTCISPSAYQTQSGSASGGIGSGGGNTSGGIGTGGQTVTLMNPFGNNVKLEDFVVRVMDFVVEIGSIVVIFMLVYVGFLFVVARGDTTKLSTARTALLWTVVGALILLGAKAITLGIEETIKAISTGN